MTAIIDRLDLGVIVSVQNFEGVPLKGGLVVDCGMTEAGNSFVVVLDERLGHRFVTMRSGADVRKSTALPTAGLRRIEGDEISDVIEVGYDGIGEYMRWAGRAFTQLAVTIGARPRNALTEGEQRLMEAGVYCANEARTIASMLAARQAAARNGGEG